MFFQKSFFIIVALFLILPFQVPAKDNVDGSGIWQRFSDYDADSTLRINHQPLSDYLEATVLPVGRSYRIMGEEKPDTYRASHIKTSKSLSPSRFEGSRLLIHAFSDGHKVFFKAYQEGLERLSNRVPLSKFNRNEQLAYWLNLYNVIVINKLVEEYPISRLKGFRSSKRGKTSFWDQKVTTVEGVPLSLSDIEAILFHNYDSPLVAFGLWQGSIGGPRLLNYAYTGKNVWQALERNAVEFVNSNRGLRPPAGTRMNVSDYYEWTLAAFGTTEDHVLSFIKEYNDPNFIDGVQEVTSISFKIYDWTIADILGGSRHSGTPNQLGGVLTAGSKPGPGRVSAAASEEGGTPIINIAGMFNWMQTKTPIGPELSLPPQAVDLLTGIRQNTRRPIPVITTEECGPDEVCTLEDVDLNNGDK